MTFPAKYSGTCDYCQQSFEAGATIARANRRDGRWYAHSRCVPVSGQVKAARFEVRFSQPLARDAYEHTTQYVNRKTAVDNAAWKAYDGLYGRIEVLEIATGQTIFAR